MANNFGDKLLASLGYLAIGVVLFIVSFIVLFNGEGRANLQKVAETAVVISDDATEGSFVYLTGELSVSEQVGDDQYLKPGDYAAVQRKVEVYAWDEEVKEDDNDVKYYEYAKKWVKEPADSDTFQNRVGHENYNKEVQDLSLFPSKVIVGEYALDPNNLRFPSYEALSLNESNTIMDDLSVLDTNYVFIGTGSLNTPAIGDMRIAYSVVPIGSKYTAFGRPDGKALDRHHGENEKNLYRLFPGTIEDAKAQLFSEYKTSGWMYRIGGFLLMWFGLLSIFKPLSTVFELVPILGNLGKSAVAGVTFLAALILTTITSLLSMVLHNPIGIAVIVMALVGVVYFYVVQKQKTVKK